MKKTQKHNSFLDSLGREIFTERLDVAHFDLISNFYAREISKLQNKADFYPYKESEILAILNGGGVFLGGFFGGELVALCAVDFDKSYQEGIKKVNATHPKFPFSDDILELSGLFVAREFRGGKIAKKMCEIAMEIAGELECDSRLFAVVLESNFSSMKNFFSLGFQLFGRWKMDEEYTFVYLVSTKRGEEEIPGFEIVHRKDMEHSLQKGKVITGIAGVDEFFAR